MLLNQLHKNKLKTNSYNYTYKFTKRKTIQRSLQKDNKVTYKLYETKKFVSYCILYNLLLNQSI